MQNVQVNELYREEYDLPAPRADSPTRSIVIATIPRTGSTYLGIELWRTGVFGAPLEYVNMANRTRDMYPRIGNGDAAEYWQGIIRRRSTPNGIFCFKAFASDLSILQSRHPALFHQVRWDHMILLRRRDKLAQAISYARAKQTRSWFFGQRPTNEPEFDAELVNQALSWIQSSETIWLDIASRRNQLPLEIFYEDVENNVSGVIDTILHHFGINARLVSPIELPTMRIQRDDISEKWRERYMKTFNPII